MQMIEIGVSMKKYKYRVSSRAGVDQSKSHFMSIPNRPRCKVFKNESKAYEYYRQLKIRSLSEQFEAIIEAVVMA